MLPRRQFARQVGKVVIINKSQHARRFGMIRLERIPHQSVTDHVAQGFRPAGRLALTAKSVKLGQQILIQRHAESNGFSHDVFLSADRGGYARHISHRRTGTGTACGYNAATLRSRTHRPAHPRPTRTERKLS